jgi:hypothetical protein
MLKLNNYGNKMGMALLIIYGEVSLAGRDKLILIGPSLLKGRGKHSFAGLSQ